VGAVRDFLIARGGAWAEALAHERALRMAFNHVMCEPGTPVQEGGEVAFFPPVTGG
jgi:molybdopterin synthase sulfur carrier subunit